MSASSLPVNRTGSPAATAPGSTDFLITAVLAGCFLLSGVAALVYQTAWTRQFALVFGTSELAVATVLAAYMGGLALGAWLANRWLLQIGRPVLVYAALELGIGASALMLVPVLLLASDALLRAWVGHQPSPPDSTQAATTLFYLLSSFVVLAVPTVLMGATLPLLARYAVRKESQIGSRIGFLYSMNTTGAVAGAVVTAFWLLPRLGLINTVRAGALLNVLVFLFAAVIGRRVPQDGAMPFAEAPQRATASLRIPAPPASSWILPLMLLSGAVSFFHEVLWTRMLSHVLGGSIHAFGVMVASFLAGIAIGGGAGALLARTRTGAVAAFAISQLGCAATAAAAYLLMNRFMPPPHRLAATAWFGAAILLPLALFIGTTYPLAVRILAESPENAARSSARVYSWNTVGAIVGALAGGFVLIPWLRFEGAIQVAVGASSVLAVASVWMLAHPPRAFGFALTACAVASLAVFHPPVPNLLLRTSPLDIASHGRILYYDVGRSASVVMLEQDGGLVLRTNGLPEAMMDMTGTAPRFSGEFWLSPLAVLARPHARDMLVVGYGGGVVVENVPPSVASVDVIELEPKVIDANWATRAMRKRDPFTDARVNVIFNDARGALNLTDRKYDAIVSQPSHPWTAGASHLYTLEFMRQARAHLNEGGVFVQWMNVVFVDEPLLRSLAATLLAAFDEVRIYRPDPNTLLFLASTAPLDVEAGLAATGLPLSSSPRHYGRVGINVVEDLFAALAVDEDGVRALAAGAPLITDDDNRMATSSVYDLGTGLSPEKMSRVLAPYDPLQQADSWVFRDHGKQLSFDYIARRQAMFLSIDGSVADRVEAMGSALGTQEAAYAVRVTALALHGDQDESRQLAREALKLFPDDQKLRFTYLRPWLGPLARGKSSPEITAEARLLTGSAAAVLQAMRLASQGDWKAVAALDPVLERVSWTDPWKLDAVQVRADWRWRVSPTKDGQRAGDECISILDETIIAQPALSLYGLRARCAIAANRQDVLTESLWSYGQATFRNSLRLPSEEREAARHGLEAMVRVLERFVPPEGRAGADSARIEEVLQGLRDDIKRLEQLERPERL